MTLKISMMVTGVVMIGVLGLHLLNNNEKNTSVINDATQNNEITGVVGVYLQTDSGYTKSDTIPNSGYVLNENESYCKINGEEDTKISISYDATNKTLSVTPLIARGTKCYLYFDETLNGAILADNPTIDDSRSGEITGPLTDNTTGTLFIAEDDYGTSYVYAGDVDNNWVSFAGFYWRIIRINGDGPIRLIYSGNSESGPVESGEATQIGTSIFNEQTNDNTYVGYMYGSTGASSYSATHANTNDSTIKGIVDTWYEENIRGTQYEQYISTEQGFCNDRQIYTGASWSGYGTLGYGTNATTYMPASRFLQWSGGSSSWRTSQNPTLKCSQSNDYFTVDGSSKGNHALDYPIGLITVDEVVLAGGFGGTANQSYYLYTNQYYWTMSPSYFNGSYARVFRVRSDGTLGYTGNGVDNAYGIRPVINLDANVQVSGNGTASNPYVVISAE